MEAPIRWRANLIVSCAAALTALAALAVALAAPVRPGRLADKLADTSANAVPVDIELVLAVDVSY